MVNFKTSAVSLTFFYLHDMVEKLLRVFATNSSKFKNIKMWKVTLLSINY